MLRSGNQSLAGKHFRPVLHNSNVFSQLGAGGGSSLALNYNFSSSHSSIPIFMEFQKGVGVGKYILWRRALAAALSATEHIRSHGARYRMRNLPSSQYWTAITQRKTLVKEVLRVENNCSPIMVRSSSVGIFYISPA